MDMQEIRTLGTSSSEDTITGQILHLRELRRRMEDLTKRMEVYSPPRSNQSPVPCTDAKLTPQS
jgi:hypothetical protein